MRLVAVVMALRCSLCAQTALTADTILLSRIRVHAAENISGLPNYTCLETIERSVRTAASRRFRLVDMVRIEVAFVDRKELFAWPGSQMFDERDITEMVSGGAIGNGTFALHVSTVFTSSVPTFKHVGRTTLDGVPAIQYNYQVPRFQARYQIRMGGLEGFVGYEGSFWVHPQTLDLLRLALTVNDIPAHLPLSASTQTLDYHRVRIGEQFFLLPKSGEMTMTDLKGNESRNRTSFANCRQYAIESTINFADVPAGPIIERKPPVRIELPPEIDIDTRIDTPIQGGTSAVGDPVKLTVARDSRIKGEKVIPKGAAISGRLVMLQRHDAPQYAYWVVGIEPQRIEFDNKFADLHLKLDASVMGPLSLDPGRLPARRRLYEPVPRPRIGILYMRGETGKIPAGSRLLWHTVPPAIEGKK